MGPGDREFESRPPAQRALAPLVDLCDARLDELGHERRWKRLVGGKPDRAYAVLIVVQRRSVGPQDPTRPVHGAVGFSRSELNVVIVHSDGSSVALKGEFVVPMSWW